MKKLLIAICILLSAASFAQVKKTKNTSNSQPVKPTQILPTTIEEYNYMVKGYRIEKEGGLDPKKGYYFEEPAELSDDLYSFSYYLMHRSNDNSLAGIMIIAYSKLWKNTYYLAIPVSNPELLKYYFKDLEQFDKPMIQSYAKYSSALMTQFSAMLSQK